MVQIFIIIFATLIVSCTSKPNTESLSCNQFFGEFQTQDSSFTWRLELLENGYAKYSQLDNTLSEEFEWKCKGNRLTISDGYWNFGFPLNRYSTAEIEFELLNNTQVRINRYHSTMIMLLFIPVLSGDGDRSSIGTRVQ